MKTLFIDTSLWNVIIILFEDGKILRQEQILHKQSNSSFIWPTIDKVLDGSEIDSIIVVNGPGSFTGVRLGVTIAKTLAYVKNIPIRTITSLECMALCTDNKCVAINDGNGFYVAKYDSEMNLIGDYAYLKENEVETGLNLETSVTIDYEKVYKYAIKKDSINPHLVNPIYIKKIGVEK